MSQRNTTSELIQHTRIVDKAIDSGIVLGQLFVRSAYQFIALDVNDERLH